MGYVHVKTSETNSLHNRLDGCRQSLEEEFSKRHRCFRNVDTY